MAHSSSILWCRIPWQSPYSLNHFVQHFVTFFLHPCEFLESRNYNPPPCPWPHTFDSKEINLVNPKGNQPWIFIGRTDAEAEAPVLGLLMWRADSLEKTLMLEKIEGRRRGRQDKMVGWHHWLNGHEFEQTLGDSEGQGGLLYCSPLGQKESDMT